MERESIICLLSSDGFGSKTFDPGQVGSIFCGSSRSGSAIYGLGLKNFPSKCQIFQFFSLLVKKISSGRVKKCPGQRRVGLLFTAGQKLARSGQGPSLILRLLRCIKLKRTYIITQPMLLLKKRPTVYFKQGGTNRFC